MEVGGDDVVGCGNDERQIYGLLATCCDRGDGTDQTPAVPSETCVVVLSTEWRNKLRQHLRLLLIYGSS